MIVWFVVLYLLVSVGIGLYAGTRVHNAKDLCSLIPTRLAQHSFARPLFRLPSRIPAQSR